MANGLAAVLAQDSLGLGSKIEVLHDLPQGMLGELPDLKEMRLAEVTELTGELRVHFDAQCSGRHAASILFVTDTGKPSLLAPDHSLPLEDQKVYSLGSEGLMNSTMKNLMFWLVAALVIFLFWSVSSRIQKNERLLRFSDFVAQVERGHVQRVTITGSNAGSRIDGEFKNGQKFRTFAPPQAGNLVNTMMEKGVEVTAMDPNSSMWLGHIISWTPIVIMIAFLIFFMRQMQGPRPLSREERRLELKARVFELLSENDEDLPKERISAMLSVPDKRELRTALYHMVREGTVLLTAEKKYRVKTME